MFEWVIIFWVKHRMCWVGAIYGLNWRHFCKWTKSNSKSKIKTQINAYGMGMHIFILSSQLHHQFCNRNSNRNIDHMLFLSQIRYFAVNYQTELQLRWETTPCFGWEMSRKSIASATVRISCKVFKVRRCFRVLMKLYLTLISVVYSLFYFISFYWYVLSHWFIYFSVCQYTEQCIAINNNKLTSSQICRIMTLSSKKKTVANLSSAW